MLAENDRNLLLRLARQAVVQAAEGRPLEVVAEPALPAALLTPGCAFVTLTVEGALRGCIGGLEPRHPLAEDVWRHAYAAAREDPRFGPVRPEELDRLHIEISCLSAPRRLDVPPEQLAARLRPAIDGVVLRRGRRQATFLPQVWHKVPDPEAFLDLLADKAGLPRSAWRNGEAEVLTYQVESFEEA